VPKNGSEEGLLVRAEPLAPAEAVSMLPMLRILPNLNCTN
jgi:hypothetical protein